MSATLTARMLAMDTERMSPAGIIVWQQFGAFPPDGVKPISRAHAWPSWDFAWYTHAPGASLFEVDIVAFHEDEQIFQVLGRSRKRGGVRTGTSSSKCKS